jgi:hypothetical protein
MQKSLLLISLVLGLPTCADSAAQVKTTFPASCQATASTSMIYVVGGDESQGKLTNQVFNVLATKQGSQVTVDQIDGNQLNTLYSSHVDRKALQQIGKNWTKVAVNGDGLVAAFQRIHNLNEVTAQVGLQAYLITPGTSDPQVLAKLTSTAQELKNHTCIQVNVIGLDKVNRLKMAEALKPIANRLRFASDNRKEWQQLLN